MPAGCRLVALYSPCSHHRSGRTCRTSVHQVDWLLATICQATVHTCDKGRGKLLLDGSVSAGKHIAGQAGRTAGRRRRLLGSAGPTSQCRPYNVSPGVCRKRRPGADVPALPGSSCAVSLRCISSAASAASSLLLPGRPCPSPPLADGVLGAAARWAASTSVGGEGRRRRREGWGRRWEAGSWPVRPPGAVACRAAASTGAAACWRHTYQAHTRGWPAGSLTFPRWRSLGHRWEIKQLPVV